MTLNVPLAEKLAECFVGPLAIEEVTLRLVEPFDYTQPRYEHTWSGWRRRLREIPEFVYWEEGHWDEVWDDEMLDAEDGDYGCYRDVWVKGRWRCDYKGWRDFLFPIDRKCGRREVGQPLTTRLLITDGEIRLKEIIDWYPDLDRPANPVAVNAYRGEDLIFTVDLNVNTLLLPGSSLRLWHLGAVTLVG